LDAASWYGYDVLSFGIETDDGKMTRLIPRNPTVPMKKTHVLTTFWDKRSTVTVAHV
jgi:molecular chaperone DnaK (HSP70)